MNFDARSSNGRTMASGAIYLGSNPSLAILEITTNKLSLESLDKLEYLLCKK